jgi:predicted ATPase
MCQGLAAWQATRIGIYRSYYVALLAVAYGRAGQAEVGLRLLTEALPAVDGNEERTFEAELYRVKGELLLKQSEGEACLREAETCFEQAIAIARGQSARSWELRAAMSLACLWQKQGKQKEARERLANVYGWFTEGLDTAGLQEARALLDGLA